MKTISLSMRQTVANDRLLICSDCPELVKRVHICKKCGCFMLAKVALMGSWCPINKWGKAEIPE